MRKEIRIASLMCFLILLGCQWRETKQPNVLLISLDTLRADHLSCYGYFRETSPFIDDLASRGVRFPNAIVNTHGTPPSHATMLSSLYQETHRVGQNDAVEPEIKNQVPGAIRMLPEILKEEGYWTVGVSDGVWISNKMGFGQGFDILDDQDWAGVASRAEKLVELIGSHEGERPIFAFLHTYEIHSPYFPPEEYKNIYGTYDSDFVPNSRSLIDGFKDGLKLNEEDLRLVNAAYDAEIKYTDDTLRKMFESLEETGFLDNCLIIVTSDHGEALGEKGHLFHPATLYKELINVPMIILGPSVPKGEVDERLSSTIDIVPTILRYLGLEVETQMEGADLLGSKAGPGSGQIVHTQYAGVRYGVRTRDLMFIDNVDVGSVELYDLAKDPYETVNLAPQSPDRVKRFRDLVGGWKQRQTGRISEPDRDVKFSEEQMEKLKSLGYVQ